MTTVNIKGYVSFSTYSFNPEVHEEAMTLPPEELRLYLQQAFDHVGDGIMIEMGRAGRGPLASCPSELDFEEYLRILESSRIAEAGQSAKRRLTALRRAEFGRERAADALRMLDSGVPYVCSVPACGIAESLAVDHIVPLSRGGTDDLANLRFLCTSHNSQKGDQVTDPWK